MPTVYKTRVTAHNLTAYGADKYIEKVEAERTSDASVWVAGRRFARSTDWHQYFDTWQEAREFLHKKASQRLAAASKQLANAKQAFDEIDGLPTAA